ncbi:MAG: hypothetical protein JXK16_06840 [Thiotrichales bacterium]|nr:hypothetical protein [Thiotrichales bacterium]
MFKITLKRFHKTLNRKQFKKRCKTSRSKAFANLDSSLLSLNPVQQKPDLMAQPTCPRFLTLKYQEANAYEMIDVAGDFKVEARTLLDWLLNQKKTGILKTKLIEWLKRADQSNLSSYALAQGTIKQLNLGFFLDTVLEHNPAFSVHCPKCQKRYHSKQIEYLQQGKGFITRHAFCPKRHEIFKLDVVHFMIKGGPSIVKSTIRIIKPAEPT